MKKNKLFAICEWVRICDEEKDVSCLAEGVVFSSQSEIDEFKDQYSCCNEIMGSVTIEGSDVTNLLGLEQIVKIDKDLNIKNNPLLGDLVGLENLSEVGFNIEIIGNDLLTNIDAIDKISRIGKDLDIRHNRLLSHLPSLRNIDRINQSLLLMGNESLTSISSLANIKSVKQRVYIRALPIEDLDGLQNVTRIGEGLRIEGCSKLTSLNQLEGLVDLGIEALTAKLEIIGNPLLISLEGIENMNTGNLSNVNIYSNGSLVRCDLESVCTALNFLHPDSIIINSNSNGCMTREEILMECNGN